jgi:hypothetical protein
MLTILASISAAPLLPNCYRSRSAKCLPISVGAHLPRNAG